MPNITNYDQTITSTLKRYLSVVHSDSPPYSVDNKQAAYTQAADYLRYTVDFHRNEHVKRFTEAMIDVAAGPVLDFGCASGYTGLCFALAGHEVTCSDFEGIGLQFVRQFVREYNLSNLRVVPYGGEKDQGYDLVISLDVIEHTGNHLAYITWLSSLARRVAICYPPAAFHPPYTTVMDEWVDTAVIRQVLQERYYLERDFQGGGRQFFVWATGDFAVLAGRYAKIKFEGRQLL